MEYGYAIAPQQSVRLGLALRSTSLGAGPDTQRAADELDRRERRAGRHRRRAIDRVHRARSGVSLAPRHAQPRELSRRRARAVARRPRRLAGERRRVLHHALRRDALLDRRPPLDGERARRRRLRRQPWRDDGAASIPELVRGRTDHRSRLSRARPQRQSRQSRMAEISSWRGSSI